MLSKTVNAISRSTSGILHGSADKVRGLNRRDLRNLFHFARRRLGEERLPQVAGSLTFTTILALVPLLTIVLAIFTTFPVFSSFRAALEAYFVQTLMPRSISNTIIANLSQFASKATGLSAVGAVALLLTSAAMMGMIERAFNQIWRVPKPRPLAQRITIYWALMTLGPLLFGLSITVTSQLFLATSELARNAPIFSSLFYAGASIALTTGAYTLIYMTVPNRFVDWRDALWGGLAAALAFEVAKRLFGLFVRQFPAYAIIYGALAALPLFLLWIYVSWLVTLLGALLTAALPIVKYERWWHKPVPGSAFVDAMAILKVLHSGAQLSDSAMVSSATVRTQTRIGYDEMRMLLERMLAEGWVGRVHSDIRPGSKWGRSAREGSDNWVMLANPDKLRLADVYRLFVFGGMAVEAAEARDSTPDSPMTIDTSALARQVEHAVEFGLDQSLAAHFATGHVAAGHNDLD